MLKNRKNPSDAHAEHKAKTKSWSQQSKLCKSYSSGVPEEAVQESFHLQTNEGDNLNLPLSDSRENHVSIPLTQTAVQTPLNIQTDPNTYSVYHPPKRNKRTIMGEYRAELNKLLKEKFKCYEEPQQKEPPPSQEDLLYTHPTDLEDLAAKTFPTIKDKTLRKIVYLHEVERWPIEIIAQASHTSPSQVRDNYHNYKHPNQEKKSKWES